MKENGFLLGNIKIKKKLANEKKKKLANEKNFDNIKVITLWLLQM